VLLEALPFARADVDLRHGLLGGGTDLTELVVGGSNGEAHPALHNSMGGRWLLEWQLKRAHHQRPEVGLRGGFGSGT
jgi:hypothetical protein